jgi:hypothetical protein
MAGWGGKRTRAGRPPSVYKTSEMAERLRIRALDSPNGFADTPLDYLIRVMRDENQPTFLRVDCAKAAAPFVHAKLSSIDVRSEEDRTVRIEFVDFSRNLILQASNNNQVTQAKEIAVAAALVDDDADENGPATS